MTFHFRSETDTKTKTATYFRPKTKTKLRLRRRSHSSRSRISFELRPTIRWLWSSLFTAENYCVFGRKRKWPKPSKIVIFGADNENEIEFRSVSINHHGSLQPHSPQYHSIHRVGIEHTHTPSIYTGRLQSSTTVLALIWRIAFITPS